MSHLLTRISSRAKRKQEPEYVPPYFWHRYSVWRWGVAPMITVTLIDLLDLVWASRGVGWNLLLGIVVALELYNVPHRIRRRWAARARRSTGSSRLTGGVRVVTSTNPVKTSQSTCSSNST